MQRKSKFLVLPIVVAIFLAIPYWKSRYFAKPVRRGGSADA